VGRALDENDHDLLELFFTNVSLAFDNLFLNKGIEDTQKEVIFHIAETMECRSAETGSHVRRVSEYVRLMALKYGLPEEEAEMLKLASSAHDLGKIGIPDSILNKPGPLSPEEYEIIKSHVQRGYELLSRSCSPIIRTAARIVLLHHERWDGEGYPQGLKEEEIHVHGRIVAVADVFDALSNRRVYHEAWTWDEVFEYFLEQSGKHFDPCLVDILLENRQEFMDIWELYHDDGEIC
jgi:response regulator RpfG family c-di-GMP phosphodiesterase